MMIALGDSPPSAGPSDRRLTSTTITSTSPRTYRTMFNMLSLLIAIITTTIMLKTSLELVDLRHLDSRRVAPRGPRRLKKVIPLAIIITMVPEQAHLSLEWLPSRLC